MTSKSKRKRGTERKRRKRRIRGRGNEQVGQRERGEKGTTRKVESGEKRDEVLGCFITDLVQCAKKVLVCSHDYSKHNGSQKSKKS